MLTDGQAFHSGVCQLEQAFLIRGFLPALKNRGRDGHHQQNQGRGRDGRRQGGAGDRLARDMGAGVGHDGQGPHTDEVQGADRQGHEGDRAGVMFPAAAAHKELGGGGGERGARDQRADDNHRIPDEIAFGAHGGHAGVVHDADRQPDQGVAQRRRPADALTAGDEQAGSDQQHGRGQGACRGPGGVFHGHAGIVGEHGDEVRGPDADGADRGGQADPDRAVDLAPLAQHAEQAHLGEYRHHTDDRGEQHETQIVLMREAVIYLIHRASPDRP